MSNTEYGKKFEDRFRKNWKACFPGTFCFRLKDQVSGYKTTSQNPCDFLAMAGGYLFMMECKETKENTLNFAKIPQLDRKEGLKDYIGIKDVQPYIIIWFRNEKIRKVIAVPASEALKIKNDGNASINIKMLEDDRYYLIELPSTQLQTFLDTDYRYLLKEEVINECKIRECFK